jgi:hypothetical protein
MKRSKILLEKVEERKDFVEYLELLSYEDYDEYLDEYLDEEERKEDLLEYLELLSYIEDDEEERIDEFEEEDLME